MMDGQIVLHVEDDGLSDDEMLERIRLFTQMMREHQQAVIRLGRQRRRFIRRLRERDVPFKMLAVCMDVSEQAVFADLRKHPID